MKIKLLFIGLVITLISGQIGWTGFEYQSSRATAAISIEIASEAEQATVMFPPAVSQKVTDRGRQDPGETLIMDEEPHRWLIGERGSEWTAGEWQMIHEVLSDTLRVLAAADLDGEELLSGYRFKRIFGEYVDPDVGKIAIVNHEKEEIWLADAAFLRLDGFYIYHELGHAVDNRLKRQLSQAYHTRTGGKFVDRENGEEWQSGDSFWMRPHGRDDREEATADAFALMVTMSETTSKKPVFSGMPADVDYSGIADAVSQSLTEIAAASGGYENVIR